MLTKVPRRRGWHATADGPQAVGHRLCSQSPSSHRSCLSLHIQERTMRSPDRRVARLDGHQDHGPAAWGRRALLRMGAVAGASLLLPGCTRESDDAVRVIPTRMMMRFPGKTDLILLTDRPPQLETPLRYFRQDFTPNEAFYVRWHLSGLPATVDIRTFRLAIAGHWRSSLSRASRTCARNSIPSRSLRSINAPATAAVSINHGSQAANGQWGHGQCPLDRGAAQGPARPSRGANPAPTA